MLISNYHKKFKNELIAKRPVLTKVGEKVKIFCLTIINTTINAIRVITVIYSIIERDGNQNNRIKTYVYIFIDFFALVPENQ